jgi:hypothetical protein
MFINFNFWYCFEIYFFIKLILCYLLFYDINNKYGIFTYLVRYFPLGQKHPNFHVIFNNIFPLQLKNTQITKKKFKNHISAYYLLLFQLISKLLLTEERLTQIDIALFGGGEENNQEVWLTYGIQFITNIGRSSGMSLLPPSSSPSPLIVNKKIIGWIGTPPTKGITCSNGYSNPMTQATYGNSSDNAWEIKGFYGEGCQDYSIIGMFLKKKNRKKKLEATIQNKKQIHKLTNKKTQTKIEKKDINSFAHSPWFLYRQWHCHPD